MDLFGKTFEDQILVDTNLGVIDDIWYTYIITARRKSNWKI